MTEYRGSAPAAGWEGQEALHAMADAFTELAQYRRERDARATVRAWLNAPHGKHYDQWSVHWDGDAFGLGYWTQDGLQQIFPRAVSGGNFVTIEDLAAWCEANPEYVP